MEGKISIKYYVYCVICLFLFLWGTLIVISALPLCTEKIDKYFDSRQEIVKGFIEEYSVYHDDELNVTCYSSANGLSCIPNIQLNRSDGEINEIETIH